MISHLKVQMSPTFHFEIFRTGVKLIFQPPFILCPDVLLFHLTGWTLARAVSTSLLCEQGTRQADAKIHVIVLPSSLPEQFNEWWQSQTTVKMLTSVWVTGWPQIKSMVKVQCKTTSTRCDHSVVAGVLNH